MSGEDMVGLMRRTGYEPMSYSGRAMFGRMCVAVSIGPQDNQGGEMGLGVALANECAERDDWDLLVRLREAVRHTKSDQLGLGIVVYWPEIEWPEGEEDAEEGEAEGSGPQV